MSPTTAQVLLAAFGRPTYASKRLVPAGTICNGRLTALDGAEVWQGDFCLPALLDATVRIARLFGEELRLHYEFGGGPVWTTADPSRWLGPRPAGARSDQIVDLLPLWQREAKRQAAMWARDHGLTRKRQPSGKARRAGSKAKRRRAR